MILCIYLCRLPIELINAQSYDLFINLCRLDKKQHQVIDVLIHRFFLLITSYIEGLLAEGHAFICFYYGKSVEFLQLK